VLVLAWAAARADAAVYYGKVEALRAAFPEAEKVEGKTFFLSDEQKKEVEELAKAPLESKLLRVHIGMRGEKVLGYAFLDTSNVRTLPETLLVVVSPKGEVARLLVAAFYEPPEYEPPKRWLEQFDGERLSPELRVERGIHGIAGSTLSAHAVTSAVRRCLALYEVLLKEGQ
jgi:hypothetical protein